jgi:hypothetical protein
MTNSADLETEAAHHSNRIKLILVVSLDAVSSFVKLVLVTKIFGVLSLKRCLAS